MFSTVMLRITVSWTFSSRTSTSTSSAFHLSIWPIAEARSPVLAARRSA